MRSPNVYDNNLCIARSIFYPHLTVLCFWGHVAQTLGYGFINPYLQAFNSNLTCGANFAISGSRAIDNGLTSFPFPTQLRQFKYLLSQAMINETSNRDIGIPRSLSMWFKHIHILFACKKTPHWY